MQGEVIGYLQQRVPALSACPIRAQDGGLHALCQGRRAYQTDYTFPDGTQVALVLVPTHLTDKTGKSRLQMAGLCQYRPELVTRPVVATLSPPFWD